MNQPGGFYFDIACMIGGLLLVMLACYSAFRRPPE
jgi:hypothetical protein